MGSMTIKEKILRCEKCFTLKRFILEPNYPKSTILSECDCGFIRMPVISFTNALKEPDLYVIRCYFCKKEPKNPLYCTGCRRIYCNTCKLSHNTKQKCKTPHIIINPYKFDFYCAEHQDVFNNAYCLGCELNICQNCINEKKHKNHIVLLYDKLQMSKNDEEKIKKYIELSLGKILKKIETSKELLKKIQDKEKRKEFKDLVNTTIKENRAILALVEYFYQIYVRVKNKNYAIIYNIMENIKFNFQPFLLTQSESLEERLNDYIIYLENDFVLFKRYVSTKNKNKILIIGNNNDKDNNTKIKNEIHNKNNKEEEINIKNESKDNIINNDINIDGREEKEKNEENKENSDIKEEIDEKNHNDEAKIKKRASIFDINEIINEKYEDDIFPDDSEEIDFDISPQIKNLDNEKKLISSNDTNEEQSKEENKPNITGKDKTINSESDFEVTFNPSAIKKENNIDNSNNTNEIKEKEDSNIINEKEENKIVIKEQEEEKEEEKSLKEEKVEKNESQIHLDEEKDKSVEQIEKNNNDIIINKDINNNENNQIEKEGDNMNNINKKKENHEEVISNDNNNEQNIIDNSINHEENSIKEIKVDEDKEEKKDEINEEKKDEIKKEIKNEIQEEKKDEIKEEKKEEQNEDIKDEKDEIKDEKEGKKEEMPTDKKEEIKEEIKNEIKEEARDEIKDEKQEEHKEVIKEDTKNEDNKNEIKESVVTENIKEKEDIIKKEEDKKESKPETLPKEEKKEINQGQNKIEDKKPVNKITSSQNSSIKSRMTLFEKKFNNTSQNNRINPPVIKRVQTTNILSNPKFSELAKKMTDKLQTGPMPTKIESKKNPENIIEKKEDPNKLIMNRPTVSKMTIKKKPKKKTFS